MAAPVQVDENQDNLDEGAAALRLLPVHINELRLAYWTTTSEWNLACARSHVNLEQLKLARHVEEEALLKSAEPQAAALRREDSIADKDPFPDAPWYEEVPGNRAREEDQETPEYGSQGALSERGTGPVPPIGLCMAHPARLRLAPPAGSADFGHRGPGPLGNLTTWPPPSHHTAPRPAPPTRRVRAPHAPPPSPHLADTTRRSPAQPSTVHLLQDEIGTAEYEAHSILAEHRRLTSQPQPRGSNELSKIIVRTQTAQPLLLHLRGITESPTTRRNEGPPPGAEPSPPPAQQPQHTACNSSRSTIARIELPFFSGDIQDYWEFRGAFRALINADWTECELYLLQLKRRLLKKDTKNMLKGITEVAETTRLSPPSSPA